MPYFILDKSSVYGCNAVTALAIKVFDDTKQTVPEDNQLLDVLTGPTFGSHYICRMSNQLSLKKTTTDDKDFQYLIRMLDHELWVELKEDQATYDHYNKVPGIPTAILLYDGLQPVASGCFKNYNPETAEIKRMFVRKEYRGQGLSKKVLQALEDWARNLHYRYAMLETSIHFTTAISLYRRSGYEVIPNYPPYVGLNESLCLRKKL